MDLCKGHANSLRVVPVLVSVLTEGARKVMFNIIRDILRNCNPPKYWKIKEYSAAPRHPHIRAKEDVVDPVLDSADLHLP